MAAKVFSRTLIFGAFVEGVSKKTWGSYRFVKFLSENGKEETIFLNENDNVTLLKNLKAWDKISLNIETL